MVFYFVIAVFGEIANHRSMPQRDPGVYLEDIEHYAGFSLEQYLADERP
jgi:hypothetical protein